MSGDALADRSEWFGQPKGLWILSGTEFWDRISFHGMVAMLVPFCIWILITYAP